MMDCKEVSTILFLFFDNEMEEGLLVTFRDHVALCTECAQRVDYTRQLLLIVRERCIRCTCPSALRQKILVSMPHRQDTSPQH